MHKLIRRNKVTTQSIICVVVALIIISVIIIIYILSQVSNNPVSSKLDADTIETSANVYIPDGEVVLGMDLVSMINSSYGKKISFRVETLAKSISYYNYEGNVQVPTYDSRISAVDDAYINPSGKFLIKKDKSDTENTTLYTATQQKQ